MSDVTTGHARNSDPATSHEAAAELDESSAQVCIRSIVSAVAAHPGLTTGELSQYLPYSYDQLRKRVPDAVRLGLIRKAGTKRWDRTGRKQEQCWPGGVEMVQTTCPCCGHSTWVQDSTFAAQPFEQERLF
jgi:hypothetical protein